MFRAIAAVSMMFFVSILAVAEPQPPKIEKLGTIDCDMVETTPVVFNGKLYRFEYVRGFYYKPNTTGDSYFRFVDTATGEYTASFAKGFDLGSAFADGDTMYAFGINDWGGSKLSVFWSKDLTNWETKVILDLPGWEIFNNSVCKGPDGYVMAFEIGAPKEETGNGFTSRFARSKDLMNWELTPSECVHRKDRYSACPAIHFLDGYYYMIYLEGHRDAYEPHITRSKDLIAWEDSPFQPIVRHSEADKLIGNAKLTEEQRRYIAGARDRNNSDFDFCEFNGKTVIYYSWGNQEGKEFLAEARYDGSVADFLRGFYPDTTTMLFASPNGDDKNPGTDLSPVKTIQRARDRARELRADGKIKDVIVYLRQGTYYLSDSVAFGSEDCVEGGSLVIRNYGLDEVIVAGGSQVGGWTPYREGIYKTRFAEFAERPDAPAQIFENGEPGIMARSPNEGWFRLWKPIIEPTWSFCYDPKDFYPQGWNTAQLQVHLIMMGTYFSNRFAVQRLDVAEQRIYTDGKASDPAYNPVDGKCYRLENALELLDAPGEFYADRKSGDVYYWPVAGDLTKAVITANTAKGLIRVEGESTGKPVHDIVFDGLNFLGAGNQVVVANAEGIVIRNCRFNYAGNNAVELGTGCTRCTVTGCEIAHPGMNGVVIQSAYDEPQSGPATIATHHNTVHNNYIHHPGRLSITGCCIMLQRAGNDNVISNNLLTDSPKSGVLMFSMWDRPREWAVMNNNVIKNNDIARCVTRSWDGGAFYIGATTENTVFENNRIADAWSWFNATWPQPEDRPKDDCSIDFDPGMTYVTQIRNNRAYGANADNTEFGRYEDETLLDNNYFESPVYPGFDFLNPPGNLMVNGRWETNKPFDASKTNPAVGLTKDFPFPYPKEMDRPLTFPLVCGFEGTLSPFFVFRCAEGMRNAFLTKDIVHDGAQAFSIDTDVCAIRYSHPTFLSNKVSVWFYDDPAKARARCFAALRGMTATENAMVALGVDGAIDAMHYIVWEGTDRASASPIARAKGWHELVFAVVDKTGHGCTLAIDGQEVGRVPEFKSYMTIDLGDPSFNSDSVGLGFDSLKFE
ncbi:MAG: right-handed parallel beta-helix repeat-containing protein [Candidatus Hydrogenedentes bacterium]|nr:right-handed parallel beta-helix repeat-containing protein [Candidatus Hydrogenedentota bacterium]